MADFTERCTCCGETTEEWVWAHDSILCPDCDREHFDSDAP